MLTILSKLRLIFFTCGLSVVIAGSVLADPALRQATEHFRQQPALPSSWKAEPVKQTDTHTAEEWHSATGRTVLGTVYIHVPPLMSAHMLVKTVKDHYAKDQADGKITREWTDSSGRHWFEVDADGTHSKGYVIAHDGKAWFVYYRYQTKNHRSKKEIAQAERAINKLKPLQK
jgi:hypothetical protein